MKKYVFILCFVQSALLYSAASSKRHDFRPKAIKAPSALAQFAGSVVAYSSELTKFGEFLGADSESDKSLCFGQNSGWFYGVVLPQPVAGGEYFYRLIPIVWYRSPAFVRDFGSWFFKTHRNILIQRLNASDCAELGKLLNGRWVRFDYAGFAQQADCSQEWLEKVVEGSIGAGYRASREEYV